MEELEHRDHEAQMPNSPEELTQQSQKLPENPVSTGLHHNSNPLERPLHQPSPPSLMATRESKLPAKLPLANVVVTSSVSKATVLVPHRSYVIQFDWKGTPRSIERRYSNVELLRNALMVLLPFTYIPPAHHKSLSIIEEEHFVTIRSAELTRFFAYILSHPVLFNQGILISASL